MAEGAAPEMPDLEGIHRLFGLWQECGFCSPDGGPLAWADLRAFGEMHGLTADECTVLRQMSAAYLDGCRLTSRLSISPMEMVADD